MVNLGDPVGSFLPSAMCQSGEDLVGKILKADRR